MNDPLETLFRRDRAAIVATLARRLRDLDLAEDALQEALTRAAARWPVDGVPDRPGAWLTVVAWRWALDRRRRHALLPLDEALEYPAPASADEVPPLTVEDDKLALILACCHPALQAESRIALTLRHVAGLDDGEIAAAFLTSRPAMTKRLVRARRKLRDSGASFTLPTSEELAPRLASVRDVIASVFTEGHLASGDKPAIRAELCQEALWLARQLHDLTPQDAETTGLLALILTHIARLPGREDHGRLIPFAEQDIGLWDHDSLTEARALLSRTGRGALGPYQLQAAIAAVQTFAAFERRPVPWLHVARLYAILAERSPSPVVEVNRAVAVGRAESPLAGLLVLDAVAADPRIATYVPFHAARADLLERAGQRDAARAAWTRARDACVNSAQRAEVDRRVALLA